VARFNIFFLAFCFSLLLPQYGLAQSKVDTLIEQGEYDASVSLAINSQDHYLAEIVQQSRSNRLAEHPIWLTLIHYKKNFFGHYESQVDSRDFFFSENGKTAPQAELEATLAAFFSNRKLEPVQLSAQCRFIARFHWLGKQLKFDTSRLPKEACDDFDLFVRVLSAEKLTVVFPTTHPNSPSSMFGHTLLRVDKKGQTQQTKMLNYSINYAAQVDPNVNGFSYSLLGLSGGFPGKFSVVPYYTKLREYAQMENRDVWEYTLNISQDEISFILMHVYELAPSYFDYYFFTENCSYHLLSLLDVSFAENRLTDNFNGWTIPVDTLRLLREKGLVTDVQYNASHGRIIRAKQQTMNDEDIELTMRAYKTGFENIQPQLTALSEERQIQVLDLLNDYYRYKKLKNSDDSATQLNKQERQILLARSKIKLASQTPDIPPPSIHPDLGHNSQRLSIGASRLMGNNGVSLSWRPAYHDLLDPSAGFVSNSALQFMNLQLNYDDATKQLDLNNTTILEILSIEPRDRFFHDTSWHLALGWDNNPEPGIENLSYFRGGAGLAFALGENRQSVLYGLLEGSLAHSLDLKDEYRFAPLLRAGFISEPINCWRLHSYAESQQGIIGEEQRLDTFVVQQSIALSRNLSFRLNAERHQKNDLTWHEFAAELHVYY